MSTQPSSSKAEAHPAITCKDIRKTYGQGDAKVEALRGVDLTISQGKLSLLMGPSGSGKTTLISIIAGILSQDSGVCLLDGVDFSLLSDFEKTRFRGLNIGFVFQAFNLTPMITIEENVAIPLLLTGVLRKTAVQRAQETLAEVGMAEKIGKYPAELSGGQQQRVAIARAIVHSPRFIVCDEPTSFLDHHTGEKIMELLKELIKKNNVTLIVVTHDPRIVHFADAINYLDDGRIVQKPF
jgi:putative ABC transport system ATP-binding protein